ncbi:sucrose transporter [Ceraceosorus bombacis]|uniref:Sucrose transporter n=1 Tax=Ceraceosorus bombacis TaxID=401625 RepID=A0A0P1B9W2_9BASI|nr:sucrose transporter [Ceraceosorus bombacis]
MSFSSARHRAPSRVNQAHPHRNPPAEEYPDSIALTPLNFCATRNPRPLPHTLIMSNKSQSLHEKDSLPQLTMSDEATPVSPTGSAYRSAGRASGWNWMMAYSCLVVALSGWMFGVENSIIGPIASMTAFVEEYQGVNPTTGELVLTARNQSMLFSIPLVGTVFGALLAVPLQKRFGRKWTLVGAYIFSLPAVFLQLFAPNLAGFIGGRFYNGLAYGAATSIAPGYLAELVVPSIRGRAVTLNNFCTILAQVISVIICWASERAYRGEHMSYRAPLAVQVCLPGVLSLLTCFCVESPVVLIQQDRKEEGKAALRKIRSYSDAEVQAEFEILCDAEDYVRDIAANTSFFDIFKGNNKWRTIVAGSLFSLNQISGIIMSTTYATLFLTQLGAGDPFVLTVVSAVCQLAGAAAGPFALDFFGRRSLILTGFVILIMIDFTAGGLAFFQDNASSLKTIAALSFIFNFVWTGSFYPCSLLMPAEIPTQRLRGPTLAYAIGWGQLTAVITTLAVPEITAADGHNLGAKAYIMKPEV